MALALGFRGGMDSLGKRFCFKFVWRPFVDAIDTRTRKNMRAKESLLVCMPPCSYGAIFRCVGPVSTIAACMGGGRSPLLSPPDKRAEAAECHKGWKVRFSDHLTLLNVYDAWCAVPQRHQRDFCRDNFLAHQSLEQIRDLKKQLLGCVQETVRPAPRKKGLGSARLGSAQ